MTRLANHEIASNTHTYHDHRGTLQLGNVSQLFDCSTLRVNHTIRITSSTRPGSYLVHSDRQKCFPRSKDKRDMHIGLVAGKERAVQPLKLRVNVRKEVGTTESGHDGHVGHTWIMCGLKFNFLRYRG